MVVVVVVVIIRDPRSAPPPRPPPASSRRGGALDCGSCSRLASPLSAVVVEEEAELFIGCTEGVWLRLFVMVNRLLLPPLPLLPCRLSLEPLPPPTAPAPRSLCLPSPPPIHDKEEDPEVKEAVVVVMDLSCG